MIELPEAVTLARQFRDILGGRTVRSVSTGNSPHKFTWYLGDREQYETLCVGKSIGTARPVGGMVEVEIGDAHLIFSEGASPRISAEAASLPKKYQFLMELDDGSFVTASVQMYGGVGIVPAAWEDNPYYVVARDTPSPLADGFTRERFQSIVDAAGEKTSAKALLATEQRVPGLGNGVLQDILFNARIHPKTRTGAMDRSDIDRLYASVRTTLTEMTNLGGRNTELDLTGRSGGYQTKLCRLTVDTPCPVCGTRIEKAAYMGGSVYYCPGCQVA